MRQRLKLSSALYVTYDMPVTKQKRRLLWTFECVVPMGTSAERDQRYVDVRRLLDEADAEVELPELVGVWDCGRPARGSTRDVRSFRGMRLLAARALAVHAAFEIAREIDLRRRCQDDLTRGR